MLRNTTSRMLCVKINIKRYIRAGTGFIWLWKHFSTRLLWAL
jgi:hypothetical protein